MSTQFASFDTRKLEFEDACKRYFDYHHNSGAKPDDPRYPEDCYRVQTELDRKESALLETPARSLADVAYKIELSLGYIDDVCCDVIKDMVLLQRALIALRAGSVATAWRMLGQTSGEANHEFAYKGASAAIDDLQRLAEEDAL